MKPHRFDALSFVFGAVFVSISVLVMMAGTGVDYVTTIVDLARWLLAGIIAIAGLAILGSTISAMLKNTSDQDRNDQPGW